MARQLADGLLDAAHLLEGKRVEDGQRLVGARRNELRGRADHPREGDAEYSAVMDLAEWERNCKDSLTSISY